MPAVAWVTLVIATLIIAAAALGLFRVIMHLRAVTGALDGVVGGVDLIAQRTAPVPEVVPSVNENLRPVREFCEAI